ncbi:MAG TPA: nucleotide exchange factor GrpE [Patescibacteria group bacterium]|nr:nucleotide exchange factor GrpE [Patescibacteria group bacterium]
MKKPDEKKVTSVPVKQLDEQVQELERVKLERDDWKGKCMRALADYQNLERRDREEKDEVRVYAAEIILGRLLPFVDTISRVAKHIDDMGLRLALKELGAILQEQGVTQMNVVGKSFNPHEMECIEVVDGEDNKVAGELLPGYLFRGKVLRIAQVKVGKKNNPKNA